MKKCYENLKTKSKYNIWRLLSLEKRCKLKNPSKNTAKSIVLKVEKSDAPKNKSQLASGA